MNKNLIDAIKTRLDELVSAEKIVGLDADITIRTLTQALELDPTLVANIESGILVDQLDADNADELTETEANVALDEHAAR